MGVLLLEVHEQLQEHLPTAVHLVEQVALEQINHTEALLPVEVLIVQAVEAALLVEVLAPQEVVLLVAEVVTAQGEALEAVVLEDHLAVAVVAAEGNNT